MNSSESSDDSNKTFTINLSSSKPSSTPVKNWESSFSKLASSYGFGAPVPSLPDEKTQTSESSSKKAVPSQTPLPRSWFPKPQFKSSSASESNKQNKTESTEATGSRKNYEEAYANLSSSYGFGGPPGSNHAESSGLSGDVFCK